MKVVVDWSARYTSEIELLPSDLEKISKAGISLEDGQAIAKWVKEQEWLPDDAIGSVVERSEFKVRDIEVEDDNGKLVF